MSKVPCEQKSQLVDPRVTFLRGVIAGPNTCSSVSIILLKIILTNFDTYVPIFDVKGTLRTKKSIG